MLNDFNLPLSQYKRFAEAVLTAEPVSGLTHNLYRYPARFSPRFAREAILAFSEPEDVVLDPFMGGGTTLIEALATGRQPIGADISPLASFVSQVKTTILGEKSLETILEWAENTIEQSRIDRKHPPSFWAEAGYQKDVPWPIRKAIESILNSTNDLPQQSQRRFAQCVLLRTAQWAIDRKEVTPSVKEFRAQFLGVMDEAINGMTELKQVLQSALQSSPHCLCLNHSAIGLESVKKITRLPKPKLVLTSPPYPGVHVIYHQWQVHSRKRTPAPFWIIGSLDGNGASHYTFGHYKQHNLVGYFETAFQSFSSIRTLVDENAIIVQLVGFVDHEKYLPKYLAMMEKAGFKELALARDAMGRIRRLWRTVPNRKWYASARDDTSSSKEVVLVHRLA